MPFKASAAFDLKFDEAITWFRARVPMTDDEFKQLEASAKRKAFTVAGVANLDLVAEVHNAIGVALETGVDFKDFQKAIAVKLETAWGGPRPGRVETIWRTNIQSAYGAGRYRQLTSPAVLAARPVWVYDAVLDSRTSKICGPLAGTTLPADDSWWDTHTPPSHHNCRSSIRSLTQAQADRDGITEKPSDMNASDGFGSRPVIDQWQPNSEKYPADLWDLFQAKHDTLPDVTEREQIKIGTHVGEVKSVLTKTDTKRILRAINKAGADQFLRDHPLERIEFASELLDEEIDTLGIYRRRKNGMANIALNVSRPSTSYGQKQSVDTLPETISSLGKTNIEALRRSLIHELGHHLISTRIKSTDLESAIMIARKRGGRVSLRADARNWQEYFCECFVAHTFERDLLLTTDPDGFAMIKVIRERLGFKP